MVNREEKKKEINRIARQIENLEKQKRGLKLGLDAIDKTDAEVMLTKLINKMQKDGLKFIWNGTAWLFVNTIRIGIGDGDWFNNNKPIKGTVSSIKRKPGSQTYSMGWQDDKIPCPSSQYQYGISFSSLKKMKEFLEITKIHVECTKDVADIYSKCDLVPYTP